MDKCQSCGMPMDKPEDHGGGKAGNPYCKYCTDDQGNLLPRETVRENMIKYHTQVLNKSLKEAERFVDEQMKEMPAWQAAADEPAGISPGTNVTASQPTGPAVGSDQPADLSSTPTTPSEPSTPGAPSDQPTTGKPVWEETPAGVPVPPKDPSEPGQSATPVDQPIEPLTSEAEAGPSPGPTEGEPVNPLEPKEETPTE